MTNRILRWSALPTGRSVAILLVTGAAAPAMAAVDLSAGATIGVEHNSNAFDLSNREEAPFAASGNPDRDDTATRLTASVGAATAGQGPLQLQLGAQLSEVDSAGFDSLDHTEHTFTGNLEWTPSRAFDVSVAASQTRLPISLADVGGQRSVLQTTTQAQLTLRIRPTPRWQIGLKPPGWSEVKTPLETARDFQLREKTYGATLDFLGAGQLVPGLAVSQTRGKNSGIDNATRYREDSVQGTLNYKATGFSTFSFAAGHTKRTTTLIEFTNDPLALANAVTNSGFTGRVNYHRELSVKTSIDVGAFRSFQQYDAGVNLAVGTGFSARVDWAATPKFSLSVDNQYTWSTIEAVQVAESIGQRKDLVRSYSLSANYRVTRRFSLRPYFTRRIRNSGLSYADQFNGTIAGMELTAKFD